MAPLATAKVNGVIVAESEAYEKVEGNVYFPPAAVNKEYFRESSTHTYCPWKGNASYYDVVVGDTVIPDGAWYYPDPKEKFLGCKDFVAFYKNKPGMTIETATE